MYFLYVVTDESTISSYVSILRKLDGKPRRYKQKSWFERLTCNQEQWENYRNSIWNILISNEEIFGNCSVCHENKGIIRCQDCICDTLCHECDRTVHAVHPFHNRTVSLDGYQYVLSPLEEIDSEMQIVHSSKKIYCVVLKLHPFEFEILILLPL